MNPTEAKIDAILAFDSLFEAYQVTVTPEEALELVRRLPALGKADPFSLEALVLQIDAAIPQLDFGVGHQASGRHGHAFRIGRERGRVITVELFKGYFRDPDRTALTGALDRLAIRAGAAHTEDAGDQNMNEFRMFWD